MNDLSLRALRFAWRRRVGEHGAAFIGVTCCPRARPSGCPEHGRHSESVAEIAAALGLAVEDVAGLWRLVASHDLVALSPDAPRSSLISRPP